MVLKKKKTVKQIKPKNVSALPAKEDFSALDSAVSELAMQTEALLGKTGEKMSKPVLPKKKPKLNSKAKSFDIIHNPAPSKRSEALLKAPHPGQKLLEADDSDSSDTVDNKSDDVKSKPVVGSPSELSAHTPGALKFTEDKTVEPIVDDAEVKKSDSKPPTVKTITLSDNKKLEAPDDSKSEPEEIETETDEDTNTQDLKGDTATVEVGEKIIKPQPDPEQDDLTSSEEVSDPNNVEPPAKDDDKMDGIVSLAEQADSDGSEKTGPSQKVQLFSDNLDDTKSESDEEDGPQPEIFDTDEYHPTLHDWSKLEHHSSWPKVVLLLLLVILAAGVYIIVSGVKLPFLP